MRDSEGRFYRDKNIPRNCFICKSTKTHIDKNGHEQWYYHYGQWYCLKHNNHYFRNPKYIPKTITFRNKQVIISKTARIGKCSKCGKKIGDEYLDTRKKIKKIKRTHIHHIEYHDDNILKDTIEICASCHGYETWKYRKKIHTVKEAGEKDSPVKEAPPGGAPPAQTVAK